MEWLFNRKAGISAIRDQVMNSVSKATEFSTSKFFRPDIFFVNLNHNKVVAYQVLNKNNIMFEPNLSSRTFLQNKKVYLRGVEEVEKHLSQLQEKEVVSPVREVLLKRTTNYNDHLYQFLVQHLDSDNRFDVEKGQFDVKVSFTGLPYTVQVMNVSYGRQKDKKFELKLKRSDLYRSTVIQIEDVKDLGSVIPKLISMRERVDQPVAMDDTDVISIATH